MLHWLSDISIIKLQYGEGGYFLDRSAEQLE